jgi:hypothetical protein
MTSLACFSDVVELPPLHVNDVTDMRDCVGSPQLVEFVGSDSIFRVYDAVPHQDVIKQNYVYTTVERRGWFSEVENASPYSLSYADFAEDLADFSEEAVGPSGIQLPYGMTLKSLDVRDVSPMEPECGTAVDAWNTFSIPFDAGRPECDSASTQHDGEKSPARPGRKRKAQFPVKTGQEMLAETAHSFIANATEANSQVCANTFSHIDFLRFNHPDGLLMDVFLEQFKSATGSAEFWSYVQSIATERVAHGKSVAARKSLLVWM